MDAPVGIVIFWLLGFIDKVDNMAGAKIGDRRGEPAEKRKAK